MISTFYVMSRARVLESLSHWNRGSFCVSLCMCMSCDESNPTFKKPHQMPTDDSFRPLGAILGQLQPALPGHLSRASFSILC